jgi:SAM-dependent methyltransferase
MTATPQRFPDYSDYLTQDRISIEESAWEESKLYQRNAGNILTAASLFSLGDSFKLLEIGCGSGWVPTLLPPSIVYVGMDKNNDLLNLARAKNSRDRIFIPCDLRDAYPYHRANADLVCSFAVLKHFSLEEFPEIFCRMLRFGPCGVFNIQTSLDARDDGTEFHHTWISLPMITDALQSEGKVIVHSELLHEDAKGEDRIFYTAEAAAAAR